MLGSIAAFWHPVAPAQQPAPGATQPASGEFTLGMAQGRDVLVVPATADAARMETEFGSIVGQSYETPTDRIHVVSFEGKTFRAATPLDGPSSRIVFDPAQRRFAALLPSIRIELTAGTRLDEIAAALGAVRVTAFDSLEFAIVELPATLHPADAVAMVGELPNPPGATLRIRGPELEWR